MDRSTILERLKENKLVMQERFNVDVLAIFGSYARNEHSSTSDLDVLYRVQTGGYFGLLEIDGLENFIKNISGVHSVDLINEKYINPIIELEIKDELVYV